MARGKRTETGTAFRIEKGSKGSRLALEGVVGAARAHALQDALRRQGRSLALESVPDDVRNTFRNAGLQHLA